MRIATVATLLAVLIGHQSADARQWTDATGQHTLEAEFVAGSNDAVVLQKEDGSYVIMPLAKLSPADQKFAQTAAKQQSVRSDASPPNNGPAAGLQIASGQLSAQEKELFAASYLARLKVDLTPLKSAALEKVFEGRVFSAKISQEVSGGTSTQSERYLFDGTRFAPVAHPITNEPMPALLKMIRKDFKLDGQPAADQFAAALEALYGSDNFGREEPKEIRHEGNQWIFIRGKFFDNFKGFVVTTDADGTVTKVAHSLKIP